MATFPHAFPFPFGGEGLSSGKPWITNLVPADDAQNVSLLRPVRLTIRDAETYIDPGFMLVEVGYAKVHAYATAIDSFEKLPKTRKVTLQPGLVSGDASYSLIPSGIHIIKTANEAQRSNYATSIPAGSGYPSAMVSAVVLPGDLSSSVNLTSGPLNPSVYPGPLMPLPYSTLDVAFASGSVLGLEHGPRNKVVYLFLCVVGAAKFLQLASFRPEAGSPIVNLSTAYDWSAGFQRYTIVWNEAYGYVEVYAELNSATSRVFRIPITSIPDMPDGYFARHSKASEIAGIYGQEGVSGDSSTWKNIAVTTDVGYPILGNIHPGTFRTQVLGAELLKTTGERDPRDLDIGCWFDAPPSLFAQKDTAATSKVESGIFKMTKPTSGKTFVIYREEPGLLRSGTDGFMIEAKLDTKPTRQDSASTGVGFVVFDGRTYFQVILFDDFATKSVGVLRRFGADSDLANYYLPQRPIDWSETGFRFIVDQRYHRMKMYALTDLTDPLLDVELDRDVLPTVADRNLAGKPAFVAFGYPTPTPSMGTLELSELTICHLYQEWESRSGLIPNHADVNPRFTASGSGSSSAAMNGGYYRITSPTGGVYKVSREVSFSRNRGGVVEARVRVPVYKTRMRTGVYLILDDGNTAFALTFVDTATGKYVALSLRDGLGGFKEIVGKEGQGTKLSFQCDWTQFHNYRIEKLPYDGVRVFLDGEEEPRILYPENIISQLPDEQFGGTPSIGFGHFTGENSTSEWAFVRGFFSGGYEISFKKNKSDKVLRQELFGNQAIVIAYAEDHD